MAKKPVRIGGIDFGSKGEALDFIKAMLNRYRPGQDVAPADAEILSQALARHPEAKLKIGVGVAGFRVRSADYGTQCFWVMRTDGSTEKFSYIACV